MDMFYPVSPTRKLPLNFGCKVLPKAMKKYMFLFISVLISFAHLSYSDINQQLNQDLTVQQQHKLSEAIEEYKKAIEINPADAAAHYNLGLAYVQKQMLNEAIAEFQIAVSLRPDYAMAHTGLGLACVQKGLLDEAIFTFKIHNQCSLSMPRVMKRFPLITGDW